MEVKDIDNSLNQRLFSKATAVSATGKSLGAGFANLLGQTTMVLDVVSGDSAAQSEKTPIAEKADKTVSKAANKPEYKEDKREDRKVRRPSDEKADVSKTPSADKGKAKKIKAEVRGDETMVNVDNVAINNQPEKNAVAADVSVPVEVAEVAEALSDNPVVSENSVLQAVEDVAPLSVELNIYPVGEREAPVAAVVNDGKMIILPQFVDVAMLINQPEVSVFDKDLGEVVTMTGEEFAAKLQQASASDELFVFDEKSSGRLVEAYPVKLVEAENVDVAKEQKIVNADTVKASAVEGAEVVENFEGADETKEQDVKKAYHNKVMVKQAAQLDKKVASADVGLNVEVSVEEEEVFAARASSASDLVRDKVALHEVVQPAAKEPVVESKEENLLLQTSEGSVVVENEGESADSAPVEVGNASNAQMQQNVVAAVVSAVAEQAETISGSGASPIVSEAGSSALPHAAAVSTGEYMVSARAETREAPTTSFKDVLKGMERETVDQVKVNITKSAVKGVDKITIQLKPEDLGHVEVKMQISKDGRLQAHIISSRPETMEILQKDIKSLEQAFNDAGFQTDSGSLSFSFRESNQFGEERNSELRTFIGNVFENEAAGETVGNDNLQNWNPAQGLNIRV